ncbi:hypothetical protein ACQPZA_33280 [Pseudonocardia xinjiangensis]|uniref:Uncharacterized protein n=1 Tax=Pseudonocardia xinjiangensis TaxID=75289 RepID=A0ABX1R789_9PSEU|nr:hypothetical protein [Pseudonocardia xinjiangensis]NMH76262.1 hypothetical protein [Pseudonocardia xinjiangensis]
MFINLAHATSDVEHHRSALLADAEHYRLVKQAKAARRQHAAGRAVDPPRPPAPEAGPPDRGQQNRAHGNDDANRRYSMSR